MKNTTTWLNRQTKDRPFFSALVVLIIVIVPGYWRLENTLNTANHAAQSASAAATSASETAAQLKIITENEQSRNKAISLSNCQTRNTASKNGRDRFDTFFTAIEVIFSSVPNQTPEQQQGAKDFVAKLRTAVPLDPKLEDVDCNGDSVLGPEDYG